MGREEGPKDSGAEVGPPEMQPEGPVSMRLEVLPGCNLPVYAPRIIRSISVSPGRTASSDLDLICGPKTIAKCSLSSVLF